MANNRMYLKFNPTGERFYLAKRMGWGWYTPADDTDYVQKLTAFFDKCASEGAGEGHHDDFSVELEIPVEENIPMKI